MYFHTVIYLHMLSSVWNTHHSPLCLVNSYIQSSNSTSSKLLSLTSLGEKSFLSHHHILHIQLAYLCHPYVMNVFRTASISDVLSLFPSENMNKFSDYVSHFLIWKMWLLVTLHVPSRNCRVTIAGRNFLLQTFWNIVKFYVANTHH